MHIVHLTASTFYGGPERQMLGLAEHLPSSYRTSFVSFAEGGRCEAFLDVVRRRGFDGVALGVDFPRVWGTLRDLTSTLQRLRPDILLTHSYKPNILGRIAARRLGIPVIAVSRGWTAENRKVRLYERLDRWNLRRMDHVVAVSEGQAAKVRVCGVMPTVIRNCARLQSLARRVPEFQTQLRERLAVPASQIIVSAGRLSPEKGFDVLVRAAAKVLRDLPNVGFVHFGDGPERPRIESLIHEHAIGQRFRVVGFTADLDSYLPWADLFVLPSYTEGLPNVVLEASAAGVAVVATAVGGTPEVVENRETGLLVPSGSPHALADAITELLHSDARRLAMGRAGRAKMESELTFEAQAQQYIRLFERFRRTPVLLQERITCVKPTVPIPSVSASSSTI